MLAGHDPAVRGLPHVRGTGEPAHRAARADRHGGRARRVSDGADLAVGRGGARRGRLGTGERDRRDRARGGGTPVRLRALAERSRGGGRRGDRHRLHRGGGPRPENGPLPVAPARRHRRGHRCDSRRAAPGRRPRGTAGGLVGGRLRRRTGGRGRRPGRRGRRTRGHRGRRRASDGVPGPARHRPDRPPRADALRPRPRRSGRGRDRPRDDGARRPDRTARGRTRRALPGGRRHRRPPGRRHDLGIARPAPLAPAVAACGCT
ncbi:hypothetical protein FHW23_001319 [Curtobacterium pusillum]|uniref:Uncharacterized protein n=1 Tax=Curtobacterium pusillum TaxID=69373 RepID=A0AAW3T512_9MICO|nr:hypothetical protein [Curtobacterium pusillum]